MTKTVTEQYTPTRFKSRFLSAFQGDALEQQDISGNDEIKFTMDWDSEAKEMMDKVPQEVRSMAVTGAEEYAQEKGYKNVTVAVINEFKKEAGMG